MRIALVVGIVALVIVLGVGLYVTDFTAYLGNNPTTCNNCHVMDAVYESWYHGGHSQWAVCGDCHTPHDLIPKYFVKAESGYHHVTAFLFGDIPDAIRSRPSSLQIVQDNCIYCHSDTVTNMLDNTMELDRYCFDCHVDVAHGERGISILPYRHEEEGK